jgi:hypothetical protein
LTLANLDENAETAAPAPPSSAPSLRAAYAQGQTVGRSGLPVTACVLDRRTVVGRSWTEGWKAGDRERRGEPAP